MSVWPLSRDDVRRIALRRFRAGWNARCGQRRVVHRMAADPLTGEPVPSCRAPMAGWDWATRLEFTRAEATCDRPGCRAGGHRAAALITRQLELDTAGQREYRLTA